MPRQWWLCLYPTYFNCSLERSPFLFPPLLEGARDSRIFHYKSRLAARRSGAKRNIKHTHQLLLDSPAHIDAEQTPATWCHQSFPGSSESKLRSTKRLEDTQSEEKEMFVVCDSRHDRAGISKRRRRPALNMRRRHTTSYWFHRPCNACF